jgi:RND family efflux transporter MFP subunit
MEDYPEANLEDDGKSEQPMRKWIAMAASSAFLLIGAFVLPGIVRQDPQTPDRLAAQAERAPNTGSAKSTAPEKESSWLGLGSDPSPTRQLESDGFDCMISPSEVVDLGSPVTGVIEEIYVERSDYVEAGQVVARLESRVEEAAVRVARARAQREVDIEQSQASLDLDRKRRNRARKLYKSNALSLDEKDEVEAQATLAALELERAREDKRRRIIRTPVSGFVIDRLMAPGEVIEDQAMLRIAQVDPLRIEAILPSALFGKTTKGAAAEIIPEAPLDQPRPAEVSLVDPIIDGASGTFGVHLLLPNPDYDLPAGLRCRVRFVDIP